jgi:hypothetical protein
VTNRDLAETIRRLMNGLEGAGLLSDDGRKVRGLVMTGQFGEAVSKSTGLSAMVRGVLSKIVERTTELDLDDVDFGAKMRCETSGCIGVARTTSDGRMYCTECDLYSNDLAVGEVITIEQGKVKR